MKLKYYFPLFFLLFFLLFPIAEAHCPLCTFGAAAAAGTASLLGLNQGAIGIFIGAFAAATGLWFSRIIKKEFKFKEILLVSFSFLMTIIPMSRLFNESKPFFVYLFGNYGTIFNRTYVINLFILGSLIGTLIVIVSPYASKLLANVIKKRFPYQGLTINFLLLLLAAALLQVGI